MDTYSLLREFADSWALLALTLIFLGVIVWVFRPGSRDLHRDIANIPLRNDTLPKSRCANCPGGCGGQRKAKVR
ncbi:MAG: cbb3-type cytochrome c oxidase subunit 3 [Pseudomonadota bacterium]